MPLKIYFCYAHKDERILNLLKNMLIPLQRENLIEMSYDRDISAGEEWEHQIDKNLNTAEIILLLISPDFIASDYCYNREMKRAIERHERGTAHIIPIILRPALWKQTPLGKIQALPLNGKPITSWRNKEEALLDVANGITKLIKEKVVPSSSITTTLSIQEYLSIIQSYIDHMSDLLRKDNLHRSKADDVVRSIARMQTLTVLRRLDPIHKEQVLRFLSETSLIPIIDLNGADLREVKLDQLDLCNAKMRRVNLSNACLFAVKMSGADLTGANLSSAFLSEINLSGSDLIVANLSETRLFNVSLSNANLNHAQLTKAHLSGVHLGEINLFNVDLSTTHLNVSRMNTLDLYIAQHHGANLKGIIADEMLDSLRNVNHVIRDTFGNIRQKLGAEKPDLQVPAQE